MASTIKVDNVQNQPGTNVVNKCGTTVNIGAASDNIRSAGNNLQASDGGNLISQSGTTITLGASGDTINLASGASQTGFGRTGTVDWDTSIKTSTVTAVDGKGYFVNTTSGGITVNLPAGVVGSIVAVSDYASTANSNNITITPNGSEKINGVNDDYTISTNGLAVTLVYADATRGWKSVTGSDADATGVVPPAYIAATGGNQPTASGCIVCTNYKVHKFTGPGTFCVSAGAGPLGVADYLVVAGGGGGGGGDNGGGGGGGGFREAKVVATSGCWTASPLAAGTSLSITAAAGPYPIAVGGGGAGYIAPGNYTASGINSSFSTITSAGGGAGGQYNHPLNPPCAPAPERYAGIPGGSGGGGAAYRSPPALGGNGNDPPTSPAQGTNGGNGSGPGTPQGSGGGGGSTAVGGTWPSQGGGAGATTSISSSPLSFGGGGGGGSEGIAGGAGSPCGTGGASNPVSGGVGTAGGTNTGGGGGSGGRGSPGSGDINGGAGGSGIVYIRYKFQ